jgi:hypothetical protein
VFALLALNYRSRQRATSFYVFDYIKLDLEPRSFRNFRHFIDLSIDIMDAIAFQVLTAVAVLLLIKSLSYLQKHDPAEPRLIRPTVPLVGHIPYLLYYGLDYFHQLQYVYTAIKGEYQLKV